MIEKKRLEITLKYLIEDVHHTVTSHLNKEKIKREDQMYLAESYLALEKLVQGDFLEQKVILERDLNKIYKVVYDDHTIFYYSGFYYVEQKVKHYEPFELSLEFQKVNLDLMAMFIKIKEIEKNNENLGGSTDNYFFSRFPNCINGFMMILDQKMEDEYVPTLYCLANFVQVLLSYLNAGKSKFKEEIISMLDTVIELIKKFKEDEQVDQILISSLPLHYFLEDQLKSFYKRDGVSYEVKIEKEEILELELKKFLRVLTSIKHIDETIFMELLENRFLDIVEQLERMSELEEVLYLRSLCDYKNLKKIDMEINPFLCEEIESVDMASFLNQVFCINEINLEDVTEEDIKKVQNMKDEELRIKVSKTIKGVPPFLLNFEASKPHGAFEISDMELPITYQGKNYYLCMPFKSGVEVSGKTVPESVSYQIYRPFTEFENCIVVFITAKKCSENLKNTIKKIKDKYKWPVDVIEEKVLAGLLKRNQLID